MEASKMTIDELIANLDEAYVLFFTKFSGFYGDRANISVIQEEIKRRCSDEKTY